MTQQKRHRFERVPEKRRSPVAAVLSVISLLATAGLLVSMLPRVGVGSQNVTARVSSADIPVRLEQQIVSQNLAESLVSESAVANLRPVYKLNDEDLIAPVPDASAYGTAKTAEELDWLPKKALVLLDGEELYFGKDRKLLDGAEIKYYYDDSILVITWKEVLENAVATFAEVKIADASQFRRFLAGGQFGADTQFTTTEMAQSVNAVLASSGDFYKFRYSGVVVYGGEVRRVNANKADTCYINSDGDLIFTYQNTTLNQAEAQKFVDENDIRFSLTFGPVLVDNGERCEPQFYDLGQIDSFSPRAALCQMGKLHYLLVTSNAEPDIDLPGALNMHQFAARIAETGCIKGYALDGGQTAALALDGQLVNRVLFNQQRQISDIIYFATAIK